MVLVWFSIKRWVVCFLSFYLLGCQSEPRGRKISLPDKEVISQSVNGIYNPSVDILFVIDDSGSMDTYQQRLRANARSFVDYFFDRNVIDYHIGVTTSSTNPKEPSVQSRMAGISYVTRTTPNGGDMLSDLINVGSSSKDATEKFLNIPELTFAHSGGFLRSEAHLAIFVITDADDQSDVLPEQAYRYLLDLKRGDHKKLHYAAALIFEEGENCNSSEDLPALKLMKMVDLLGDHGYSFDLCDLDYGKELAKVARSIVYSVLTIELDDLPDVTSIRICYREVRSKEREFCETGQEIFNGSDGWIYDIDTNAIHFSSDIALENRLNGSFDIQYIPIYSPEDI